MTMTTIPDGDFADAVGEILGATFMTSLVLDQDLAFGATGSIVDFDRTRFLSPTPPHTMRAPRHDLAVTRYPRGKWFEINLYKSAQE